MPSTPQLRPLVATADSRARGHRRRVLHDLRSALGRGELALHYQPRIRLADGTRTGAEALLRWYHPRRGQVPPAAFIPLAEGSDLILALGGWVLREAACTAARYPGAGRISVNVSIRQVHSGALPAQVEAALAESGLPPERLELELTESLLLQDAPEIARMLGALRDRGIGLALDDFGTGYASLARLRRLPFGTIKLDRSFIVNLPEDVRDVAILRAVRDIARALHLTLVAEGVERPAQRDLLAGLGCEEAQGWLFGRAVPAGRLWGPDADPLGPVTDAPLAAAPVADPPLAVAPLAATWERATLGIPCQLLESPSLAPASPASPAPVT